MREAKAACVPAFCRAVIGLVTAAALVFVGCSSSDQSTTVLVMAAASLTDAFVEMEAAFEAANPAIDVQLNLAGSTTLREQILEGAPADVFASANEITMRQVVVEDAAVFWQDFATNELVIAVPVGNPGNVTSLRALANPDLLVGLCAEQVPCGKFARDALAQAGVAAVVDTNEGDVRGLLTKIEAGELDVGIVYATDVATADGVTAIALPPQIDVPIVYPIATLSEAPNGDAASEFVAFVVSPAGQTILATYGFGQPSELDTKYTCSDTDSSAEPCGAER